LQVQSVIIPACARHRRQCLTHAQKKDAHTPARIHVNWSSGEVVTKNVKIRYKLKWQNIFLQMFQHQISWLIISVSSVLNTDGKMVHNVSCIRSFIMNQLQEPHY